MYNMDYREEFYHSGILGMKWGKRNGPPYPLKPFMRSAAEKKAAKKAARKNKGKKAEPVQRETTPEEDTNQMQQQIMGEEHKKFKKADKFGTKDLKQLKDRYNTEKEYNEALVNKLKSEDQLNDAMMKHLSKKQRKVLEKKMAEMEANAAYNEAVRKSIESQIKLLESQKTLRELKNPPKPAKEKKEKKPGLVKRGISATGEILGDIGKRTLKEVGGQAAEVALGEALNRTMGKKLGRTVYIRKGEKQQKQNNNDNNN